MDASDLIARLRGAVSDKGVSPTANGDEYTILTSVGPTFLARDCSNALSLLIPLSHAPTGVGRRGGGFSLNAIDRVVFNRSDRRWEQPAAVLECTDSQLVDTFLVLIADLGRKLGSLTGAPTWAAVLAWVEEWQALLGRRRLLTAEQQLGLWGELWVISQASDPEQLLAGWRGPDADAVDFFLDGVGLEIKASRRAHVHHVSQRQIDLPVGGHASYLLSLWVAPDPVRGTALSALVDILLSRTMDAPAFLRRLTSLGYSLADHEEYSTSLILLERPCWFRLEDVPRVRMVDHGVSELRYIVTLDSARAIGDELALTLWQHFCNATPLFHSDRDGLQ